MQYHEVSPRLRGFYQFALYRGDSRDEADLVEWFEKENIITNTGKGLILDRTFGLSAAVAIAGAQVGTNATAAAVGDTAITSAGLTNPYKAFTSCSRSSLTVTSVVDFATGDANGALTEVGLLTAQNGVLLNRLTFAAINKTSALSLQITISIVQQ